MSECFKCYWLNSARDGCYVLLVRVLYMTCNVTYFADLKASSAFTYVLHWPCFCAVLYWACVVTYNSIPTVCVIRWCLPFFWVCIFHHSEFVTLLFWWAHLRNVASLEIFNWQYVQSLSHTINWIQAGWLYTCILYRATHCMETRYMIWPLCPFVFLPVYCTRALFKTVEHLLSSIFHLV